MNKNQTATPISTMKYPRQHLRTGPALSPRFLQNTSPGLLFALLEQKQRQLRQYRSFLNECCNSHSTDNSKRNSFPPSTVRHQKSYSTTPTSQCENKDSVSKSVIPQSRASARLESEIDYFNNKLRRYEHSNNRGVVDGLLHSAATQKTNQTTKNQCAISPLTHAYQIPQQSNIGSESAFSADFLVRPSKRTRSLRHNRNHNDVSVAVYPFHMTYLTNLMLQQAHRKDNNTAIKTQPSITNKTLTNSRANTVVSPHQSSHRLRNILQTSAWTYV